jgi:hypothetical protein
VRYLDMECLQCGMLRYPHAVKMSPNRNSVISGARLRLVRRLISPLRRPIDVKFKIGAAPNLGFAVVFSVSGSSRGSK